VFYWYDLVLLGFTRFYLTHCADSPEEEHVRIGKVDIGIEVVSQDPLCL